MSTSPSVVQKNIRSARECSSERNDSSLEVDVCRQESVIKMKRSMKSALSDMLESESPKESSPGLQGNDLEESARKQVKTNDKTESAAQKKIISNAVGDDSDARKAKPKASESGGQKGKLVSSTSASLAMNVNDRLSSQVQQMFQQSPPWPLQVVWNSLFQQELQHMNGMLSQFPASSFPLLSNYSTSYGQSLQPSSFLQGVQPGAFCHTMYPMASPMYPTVYNPMYPTSAQSFHTASQKSASSQLQEQFQLPLESEHDLDQAVCFNLDSDSALVREKDLGAEDSTASGEVVHREDQSQQDSLESKSHPLEDYKQENYQKKLKQLPRQWEFTKFGSSYRRQGQHRCKSRLPVEFSIMTYNILAQNLLENHQYLYSDMSNDESCALQWEQRRQRLIAEIASHDPDIINLQEVHHGHFFDYLKPRLEKLGYGGCYQKRTGDKQDGCATLWKKKKFHLLRSSPVKYCRGGLLDRDNIAIIVELQPLRTKKSQEVSESGQTEDKVVIANTHLLFNPRRGDIKLAQLMILLAEIDKCAYLSPSKDTPSQQHSVPPATETQGRYCPVILTGDFNMEPQSELYKFVISGQMAYEGLLVREISGQEEGYSGRNHLLERNFFSPMYGVTNYCQYHTAVMNRVGKSGDVPAGPPHVQESSVDAKSSDSGPSSSANSNTCVKNTSSHPSQMPVNTGHLCHHLNFVSAYRHKIERLGKEMEVTTHHNNGKCSVDYIFYTVNHKEVHSRRGEVQLSHIRDGNLVLLARYGLMSAKELDDMGGIPNDTLASDHLCLITKFLLK